MEGRLLPPGTGLNVQNKFEKIDLPATMWRVIWGMDTRSPGLWTGDLVLVSPLSHESVTLQCVNNMFVCLGQSIGLTKEVSTHLRYEHMYHRQYGSIEAEHKDLTPARKCFELRAVTKGLMPKGFDMEHDNEGAIMSMGRNTVSCAVFEICASDFLSRNPIMKELQTPDGYYFRLECLKKEYSPSPSQSMLLSSLFSAQESSVLSQNRSPTMEQISQRLSELSDVRESKLADFLSKCGMNTAPDFVRCDMYSFFGLPNPLDPVQMTGLNAALAEVFRPTSLVHMCFAFQQELVRMKQASPDPATMQANLKALGDSADARAQLVKRVTSFINMSVVSNFDYTNDSSIQEVSRSAGDQSGLRPVMGVGENQNLAGLTQRWDLETRLNVFAEARKKLIKAGVSDTGRCLTSDDVAYVRSFVEANGVSLFGDCEDTANLQTLIHTATKLWPSKEEYEKEFGAVLAQMLPSDERYHGAMHQIAEAYRQGCCESTSEMVTGLVLARGGYVGAKNADDGKKQISEDIQFISSAYHDAKKKEAGHAVALLADIKTIADVDGVQVVEIGRDWNTHEGTARAEEAPGLGAEVVNFALSPGACPEIRDKFLKYDKEKMDRCFAQNLVNQIRAITLKNKTGLHGKPANVFDPGVESSFYQWMMFCGPYMAVTSQRGRDSFVAAAPAEAPAKPAEAPIKTVTAGCMCGKSCGKSCKCKEGCKKHCRCTECRTHRVMQGFSSDTFGEAGLDPGMLRSILEQVMKRMEGEMQPQSVCSGVSMVLAKTKSTAPTAQPFGVTVPLSPEEKQLLREVARGTQGVFTSLDDIKDAMRRAKYRLVNTDFVQQHPGPKILISHPITKIPMSKMDEWETLELHTREELGKEVGAKIWNLSTHAFYLCFPEAPN